MARPRTAARPRTVYQGANRPNWILTLVIALLVGTLLAGLWLFYDLQQHLIYDKDGVRLAAPGTELAARASAGGGTGRRELSPVDAEIVVDKTDYSAITGTDAAGLTTPLHARFVPAGDVNAGTLNGYTYGTGSYNALVLELKDESGALAWRSAAPLAESYGVNGEFEMSDYIARLKETGVWLAAQLCCLTDGSMAARNPPMALRAAANDGLYVSPEGRAWLDPYNAATREYFAALITELAGMGFDEILLTGLYLPEDGTYRFGGAMTETPDGASAVSSFALYLRALADELGIRLSGTAERASLEERAEDAAPPGQDLSVFFKAFDRVAFPADYGYTVGLAAMESALGNGGSAGTRIVPVVTGHTPEHESYIVK